MNKFLEGFIQTMRPAFSRRASFVWFVVAVIGLALRADNYGVSSIMRALWLPSLCYPCLLHFFHSSAWSVKSLAACWWQWLVSQQAAFGVNQRIVLLGDHTKTPKDGRRMPALETLHQESESNSKPSYFRGHHWGFIALLLGAEQRLFASPLVAEIARQTTGDSRSTRLVTLAAVFAQSVGLPAYLVLDAYFAVGPVFIIAAQYNYLVHIVVRAKSNAVAYLPAPKSRRRRAGRPRKYGRKLKLYDLFERWPKRFLTIEAPVYRRREEVRYLILDLLWKPTKGLLRFILLETSHGRIVLMTTDFNLQPIEALQLYCGRSAIETLFSTLKNLLGGMGYRFWSKYLQPQSRRPRKNSENQQSSSQPNKTENTLAAIEKFLQLQMLVVGLLQLLAIKFPLQIHQQARCWLRTPPGNIPSEFVTREALAQLLRNNLRVFAPGRDNADNSG